MTTKNEFNSRRELLKKTAYVMPAVLTMAIAPGFISSAQAGGCSSKAGCDPTPVSEPGVIGLLGLGLAGVAASRLLQKKKSKGDLHEDSKDQENS